MPDYIVKGEHWIEELDEDGADASRWEPFEETYTGDTPGDARWSARRAMAAGEPLADIEHAPPNPERERVEAGAPTLDEAAELLARGEPVPFASDRTELRNAAQRREYERLVTTVRVLSVRAA